MASRSRLFSPRDRGRATDGTILTAFQLRTILIDDRNYPEEIPSAYRDITITICGRIRALSLLQAKRYEMHAYDLQKNVILI